MSASNSITTVLKSALVICCLLAVGCSSTKKINKDFLYFQRGLDSMGGVKFKDLVIQPNDQLSIQILSKTPNQEQTAIYNLPNVAGAAGGGYLVNINGEIEIPVLGNVQAAGLTRVQLQQSLTDKLTPYIKLPAVIVRFADFKVNVLGEVSSPGIKTFPKERVTILDAIGAAGDLTEMGKRQDVLIIREEDGRRTAYNIDLRSASLFQAPGYQLKQNDVVYVGASEKKLQALSRNPNKQADLQSAFTILSVITSLFYLITTLTR